MSSKTEGWVGLHDRVSRAGDLQRYEPLTQQSGMVQTMLKHAPGDLALVILLTLACIPSVLIPPLNETPVRVLLGLLLVLFLPGYSLIAALFPRKDDLDGIERIAPELLGLGIAVVPVLVVLSVFTVLLAVVACVRRQGLHEGERFVVEGWGFERRFLSPKTN